MAESYPSFDPNQSSSILAAEWPEWKNGMERYLRVKKIENDDEKIDMMLHCAGTKVQSIFDTLPDIIEGCGILTAYQKAIRKLDSYFLRKINFNIERKKFRSMGQQPDESVSNFILRLRKQAIRCNFETMDMETNIIEQIAAKATSDRLRCKIIERNCTTIDEVIDLSELFEMTSQITKEAGDINFIKTKRGAETKIKTNETTKRSRFDKDSVSVRKCFRCGCKDHISWDQNCPARKAKCSKCNRFGHFASECRSKLETHKQNFGKKSIRKVEAADKIDEVDMSEHTEYVMTIDKGFKINKCMVTLKIGGISTEVLIDSGADVNVMDNKIWSEMKQNGIKILTNQKGSSKILRGIGNKMPLEIIGEFEAYIESEQNKIVAKFYVIVNGGHTILGFKSSMEMNLLKIGYDINKVLT